MLGARWGQIAIIAVAAVYYALLMTGGGRLVFENEPLGLAFNHVAANLLSGRFDVDPAVIDVEAFVHDGRSYVYFGVLPAVLRMPLLPFLPLQTLSVTWLYTVLALTLGAAGHVAAVSAAMRAAEDGPAPEFLRSRMILAALISGPPIMLALSRSVFDESMAWAWALSMVFVALALRGLTRPAGYSTGLLAAMATVAGLCVHTRPSTAIGLLAALALLMVMLLGQHRHSPWICLRTLLSARMMIPCLIVVGSIAAVAGVNYGRWGDALLFADWRDQVFLNAADPDRLPRLDSTGAFNWRRIPFSLIYYVVPIWALPGRDGWLLQADFARLFDAVELPPTSLLLTDPLTSALAICGAVFLARRAIANIAPAPAIAVALGLCVAPALILTFFFLAFRYRLEFHPLLVFLACLGALGWAQRTPTRSETWRRRMGTAFIALFLLQFASAHIHAGIYLLSEYGSAYRRAPEGLGPYYRHRLDTVLGVPPAEGR